MNERFPKLFFNHKNLGSPSEFRFMEQILKGKEFFFLQTVHDYIMESNGKLHYTRQKWVKKLIRIMEVSLIHT